MISSNELQATADTLGVPLIQVRRDHLISHVLHAVAELPTDGSVVFFGGTALCRTWCPDLRLSEDIDLIVADYPAAATAIPQHISRRLRREFPDLEWGNPVLANSTTTLIAASAGLGASIKVQFVEPRPQEGVIPVEIVPVDLRYSDLPSATNLVVPTKEGFAAMKLMAWHQRQAPRDLYDLAALAAVGAVTEEAIELTNEIIGYPLGHDMLNQKLTPRVLARWQNELAHQVADFRSAEQCLADLLHALASQS